ncbi:MAG: ABC transporter ATP-binding protein [Clostridia bacterium]|nr:ABC transporter ATP-binding protein [Clostridia bacterium]
MIKAFFKKYGWRYFPGAIFLLLCSYLSTRTPLILGNAIDAVRVQNWDVFIHEVIMMLVVAVGIFVTRFIWRYFIVFTSREMDFFIRDRLYWHLQLLPQKFFGTHRSGDLMAYAINDVNAVRMMFGMVFANILNSLSTLLLSVSSMAGEVNVKLTLLALIPIPFAIAGVLIIGKQVRIRFRRVQELFSQLSGHVQENINGMRVLKAFAQEKHQYDDYDSESNEKYNSNIRLFRVSALLDPVISTLFGVSYLIGLVYGGQMVINGEIGLGSYVAFNTYLTVIVGPIMSIGRISNMLQRGMASYKRLDLLMKEEEIPEFDRTDDGKKIKCAIEVKDLTFVYPETDKPVLKNVNLSVKEGATLGVVGPTGSGKSTLMQLLIKLLPVEKGSIYMGGRDLADIPAASIRNAAGYVPQDGFLFNISIRENIDFFCHAGMDKIEKAVRIAGLEGEIERFPEGYETLCGERGNHLSGGQRQRASLARALVRDPQLLLLDDTLSAVDAHTETAILSALEGELKDRTAVIIAHRLSAVKGADEIIYLDEGEIIERGTHDELVALGGRYAEMWEQQQREEAKH